MAAQSQNDVPEETNQNATPKDIRESTMTSRCGSTSAIVNSKRRRKQPAYMPTPIANRRGSFTM
jgi:hypothetical protein